jgi:4-hydroxybenzoate polyprenyltransferase
MEAPMSTSSQVTTGVERPPRAGVFTFAWIILRQIRVHQWAKNLLLFVPLVAGHRLKDGAAIKSVSVAFVVWGMMASAIYVFNDIYDLEADRKHVHKRKRPLAAGLISPTVAMIVAIVLGTGGILLAGAVLSPETRWWLFGYAALAMSYLLFFKRRLLVDVLVLATLYTLRIMAGGAAGHIPISHYLLAFSMFIFTSLAFAKRFTELKANTDANELGDRDDSPIIGRAYLRQDLDILRVVGPTTGYLAILILALYFNSVVDAAAAHVAPAPTGTSAAASSPNVIDLAATYYHRPEFLYLVCPLLAYWITRIWFIANRGNLHHDPLIFAMKDPKSYAVGALCVLIILAATIP